MATTKTMTKIVLICAICTATMIGGYIGVTEPTLTTIINLSQYPVVLAHEYTPVNPDAKYQQVNNIIRNLPAGMGYGIELGVFINQNYNTTTMNDILKLGLILGIERLKPGPMPHMVGLNIGLAAMDYYR